MRGPNSPCQSRLHPIQVAFSSGKVKFDFIFLIIPVREFGGDWDGQA